MSEPSKDAEHELPEAEAEVTAPGIPALASGPRLRAASPSDEPAAPNSVPPGVSQPRLAVPRDASERLGPYQLVSEIASGGMGKIYLAVRIGSEGFRYVVTIKRLHPALVRDQSQVDMFIDEAALSSLVRHAFVREVSDFGYENGSYYMAMEFLNGEPLSAVNEALIGEHPAPRPGRHVAIVARIIADLCSGLHAIHRIANAEGELLDVVHRDISPHNLFVLHDGSCRVTDLGIAHAKGRRQSTTGRRLKGKLAYMSPEYLSQQDCDQRTDIWSIGVVFWELLSGKRLFRRENEALTLQAVLHDDVPPPSAADRAIDSALDRIVAKALQRDPAKRYSSALELMQELEAYLAKNFPPLTRSDVAGWLDKVLPESRRHLSELERAAQTAPLIAFGAATSRPPAALRAGLPSTVVQLALLAGLAVLLVACYALLR